METMTHPNGTAPTAGLGPRGTTLGVRGGKVGQGWQAMWDRLDRRAWTEGWAVATKVAEELGGVAPSSLVHILHRMAAQGVLEHEKIAVDTLITKGGVTRPGKRQRTHYRIAASRD
jgi:hypothetical protein